MDNLADVKFFCSGSRNFPFVGFWDSLIIQSVLHWAGTNRADVRGIVQNHTPESSVVEIAKDSWGKEIGEWEEEWQEGWSSLRTCPWGLLAPSLHTFSAVTHPHPLLPPELSWPLTTSDIQEKYQPTNEIAPTKGNRQILLHLEDPEVNREQQENRENEGDCEAGNREVLFI